MSYIPNKAMPHAAPHTDDEDDFEDTGFYEWDGEEDDQSVLERMAELARDNPKTAFGAGVALIAGAIAGLAWPFVKPKTSRAPKRKQPGKKRQSPARKSSTTTKAKGTSAQKAKAASTGSSTGRKSKTSTKVDSAKASRAAAPKSRTASAKTSGKTTAAKPRKPRSDKGVPRPRVGTHAKSEAGPSTTT